MELVICPMSVCLQAHVHTFLNAVTSVITLVDLCVWFPLWTLSFLKLETASYSPVSPGCSKGPHSQYMFDV